MPTGKKRETKRKPARLVETAVLPRRGVKRSYIWAGLFTLLIAGWMLSGILLSNSKPVSGVATSSKTPGLQSKLFRVRVKTLNSRMRKASLVLRGRTEAYARVDLQAETAGIVEQLPVAKGAHVAKGNLVCKLEPGARQAMINKAEAEKTQMALDLEASQRLVKQGHTAKLKLAERQAKLDAARAIMEEAKLDLARTYIKAPFDGVIEAQPANVGDYLSVGETCATLVALDPLKIVGAVSERQIEYLHKGMIGQAELVTGETVSGPIRFIASAANKKTRTFQVELEVENKDGRLRDGVTADITIALSSDKAHKFSPALLALNDAGDIGVRIVENDDTVRFVPVQILSDESDGIWVSGLPDTVTIITVGQEYVTDGQKVEPVPDTGNQNAKESFGQ